MNKKWSSIVHKYLISQKQKQKVMVRRNKKDVVTVDLVFGWSVMETGSMLPVYPSGRNVTIIQSIHQHSKWEEEQQHVWIWGFRLGGACCVYLVLPRCPFFCIQLRHSTGDRIGVIATLGSLSPAREMPWGDVMWLRVQLPWDNASVAQGCPYLMNFFFFFFSLQNRF